MLFSIAVPLPYTKYGRQCSDIGCLSSQVCVMAYDSCSLGQRENTECGRYPTCKKSSDAGLAAGPSDNAQDVYSNQPAPPKTAPPSDDDVLASLGLNPNVPNNNRPATSGGGFSNPYPQLPPSQPQPASPYYPPAGGNGNNGNNGNNNYYGGGGANNGGGGGGNRRPGQFDGAGGNVVVPTPKPAAPSGGFFSGILSGVQNAVSNAVKQQVGTYINQRLGIGPAAGQAGAGGAGGLGGLFNAQNFIDSKKFGGLFSENTSGSRPYPVTTDQRSQSYGSNNARPYRDTSAETAGRQQGAAGTPPTYGWKLD